MKRQLACIWRLKRCLLRFSLSVAGQRIEQSVTQLEGSLKRRGERVCSWAVCVGKWVFPPLFIQLFKNRAVEYGSEGHLGLMCDVLFKEGYNSTHLCIYFIPVNIFYKLICLNVKLTQEIEFLSLCMTH